MSYQDLAVAVGGTPRAGMAMGQYLVRATDLPPGCVHRVLRKDGSVSPGWQGEIRGPEEARALLEEEVYSHLVDRDARLREANDVFDHVVNAPGTLRETLREGAIVTENLEDKGIGAA